MISFARWWFVRVSQAHGNVTTTRGDGGASSAATAAAAAAIKRREAAVGPSIPNLEVASRVTYHVRLGSLRHSE